jgi:Lar family restriction alleviation protein
MENKIELLPCPFCGSEAEFKTGFAGMNAVVRCTGCGIFIQCFPIFHEYSGDYMKEETFNKVADMWNRRTQ